MPSRRATVTADQQDLAVLVESARRRGVSLARVLSEAVADKAHEIRQGRSREVGTFVADPSIAAQMRDDAEAAVAEAFR